MESYAEHCRISDTSVACLIQYISRRVTDSDQLIAKDGYPLALVLIKRLGKFKRDYRRTIWH
jgi:hypothetical protein